MKYVKTHEELKDYYSVDKHDWYFVVTKNEEFVLPANWMNLSTGKMTVGNRSFPITRLQNDNLSRFTSISYGHRGEEKANKLVDIINSGPDGYKGIDDNGTEIINLKTRKVVWDDDIQPYKGYLNFSLSGGLHKNIMEEYPDTKMGGVWYNINGYGYSFMQDHFHRYSPYDHHPTSMRLYMDLKDQVKVVSYTNALMRTDKTDRMDL